MEKARTYKELVDREHELGAAVEAETINDKESEELYNLRNELARRAMEGIYE